MMNILMTPDSSTNLINDGVKNKADQSLTNNSDFNNDNQSFFDLLFSGGVNFDNNLDIPFEMTTDNSGSQGGSEFLNNSSGGGETRDGFYNPANDDNFVFDDGSLRASVVSENHDLGNENNGDEGSAGSEDLVGSNSNVFANETSNNRDGMTADTQNGNSGDEKSAEEVVSDLRNLESEDDLQNNNPGLHATLEGIISILEVNDGNAIKPETIDELNSLLSKGVKLGQKKGVLSGKEIDNKKDEIIAKLEKIVSRLEGEGVDPRIVKNIKDAVIKGVKELKNPELILKVENAIAAMENSDGMAKNFGVGAFDELINNGGNNAFEKLEKVMAAIESMDKDSEAVSKLKGLISKDGVGPKERDLIEKAVAELKLNEGDLSNKNGAKVDSSKLEHDKAALNKLADKLGEVVVDKVVKNESSGGDKKTAEFEKNLNESGLGKTVENVKDPKEGLTKNGKKYTPLDGEMQVETRVVGDGNSGENTNSERSAKVDIKTVSQDMKNNEGFGQNQNKGKSEQGGENGKTENMKVQKNEADVQVGNNKTVSTSKAEASAKTEKAPMPRDVTPSEVKEMVLSGARKFQKGGSSEVHLNITRPDLGGIKISFVEGSNGKLEVQMTAERPEAAELLKQNSGDIKQLLAQEGIDLSRLDISETFDENRRSLARDRSSSRRRRNNSSGNSGSEESTEQSEAIDSQNAGAGVSDDKVNVLI